MLSKKILIAAASVLAFIAISANAADFNKVVFQQETLPNGLKVIYHVDKSAPIVATVLQYRVGSVNEDPSKTGYAHFFEHLMFEATDEYPRAALDKYIEEAGGNLNASTNYDHTTYYFELPANEIKLALWAESQRMRRLHVDSIGVAIQKNVVIEELRMRVDNSPYGKLWEYICNYMFTGTPYYWPVIGSIEHLQKAKVSDFKSFYDMYYTPDNATLVISGDFNVDMAKIMVSEYFGNYSPSANPIKDSSYVQMKLKKTLRKTIEDEKASLPGVFIGFPGPDVKDSLYYAAELLMDIFAQGKSSRMYKELVDREQLAAETSAFNLALRKVGGLIFYGIAQKDISSEKLEEAIIDEIEKLLEDGITDEELQKAKNNRESDFVNSKLNALDKAKTLAQYQNYYGDPSLINNELDMYNAVTKKDIMTAAKLFLTTDKYFAFVFEPVKK